MSYGTNGTFTVNNLVGGTTKTITPRTFTNQTLPDKSNVAINTPYANLIAAGQAAAYGRKIADNPNYALSQTPDIGAMAAANRPTVTTDTGTGTGTVNATVSIILFLVKFC